MEQQETLVLLECPVAMERAGMGETLEVGGKEPVALVRRLLVVMGAEAVIGT